VDGERYIPEDDSSGGEMDVASFALRVILWAIQYDRTEATLLFDEPFRNVDPNKLPCLREMTQYLSEMLGIQFVIVTHSPELAESADRSFVVVREKGISKVSK
jgi:DNA repair exonuclease SbcCD ATPase subunit